MQIDVKLKIYIRSGKIANKPYNATDAQNDYLFKTGLSKGKYILRQFPKMAKFIEDKIINNKWAQMLLLGG